MQALPHNYRVSVKAQPESDIDLAAEQLPGMRIAPPANFGGPGDEWSPEDLLVASMTSCFLLSFKAIARISRLEWTEFDCECAGTLDKMPEDNKKMAFAHFDIQAKLIIPNEADKAKAEKLLHKAEETCLISNSLTSEKQLSVTVEVAAAG